MIFRGVFPALVTPFTKSSKLDEEAFEKIIHFLLSQGVSGLVLSGTTGEAPTLSKEEKIKLIEISLRLTQKNNIPTIVGTGNYNTQETIFFTKEVAKMGVKGALVITPYYNKPTQKGLFQHFQAVANACPEIDIIIYNVPSRTNVNILPETVQKLVERCPNITGIKDATGDLTQVIELHRLCGESLSILSGEDRLVLPYISCGAKGVISVGANILPHIFVRLVQYSTEEKIEEARNLQEKIDPFLRYLSVETNPIPIKFALKEYGFQTEYLRLPLHQLSEEHHTKMRDYMKELSLL